MVKKFILMTLSMGTLLSISSIATPAFAQTAQGLNAPVSAADQQLATLNTIQHGLDILNMIVAAVAVTILLMVISQYGASEISVIFRYFVVGTLALAGCRLFILLGNAGILKIGNDTIDLGWHILFYLAMITFFIAGKNMIRLSNDEQKPGSSKRALIWEIISALIVLAVFFGATTIDAPYTAMFDGTWAQSFGLIHFIAFVLGGLAAFYLFYRAKLGNITTLLAVPFLITFGLFAGNHLWELLHESWKIIPTPDGVGELVEQLFVVPAFFLITYSYLRLWKLIKNNRPVPAVV